MAKFEKTFIGGRALIGDQAITGDVTITGDLAVSGEATIGTLEIVTGITAFATGGQANAVALTGRYNNVTTCATAADSVKLQAAATGGAQTVKNSGAATLAIFPATGDSINALAVNLSVDLPPGGELTFWAISATVWESRESLYLPAPTTQTGGLEVKAANSAANYTTTLTNASMGQDTTLSLPDPGVGGADIVLDEGAQTIAGVKTFSGANVHSAANLFSAGAAAAAVAQRLGATATEGFEVRVIDETLAALAAVSTDLTEDIPDGAVPLCSQANIETLCVAAGTSVKVGIGPVADPDKYGISADLLKNTKIDLIPDWAVLSGAEDVQVNACATGGGIGDSAFSAGAVRVRFVYAVPNSLDDAA